MGEIQLVPIERNYQFEDDGQNDIKYDDKGFKVLIGLSKIFVFSGWISGPKEKLYGTTL